MQPWFALQINKPYDAIYAADLALDMDDKNVKVSSTCIAGEFVNLVRLARMAFGFYSIAL